jgi:CRP-like cAMP-binding protein
VPRVVACDVCCRLCNALTRPRASLQVVIREGEPGSDFFIIEEGEVRATKSGVEEEVSRRLSTGDYFGERALLTNEVSCASLVRVCGAVWCGALLLWVR